MVFQDVTLLVWQMDKSVLDNLVVSFFRIQLSSLLEMITVGSSVITLSIIMFCMHVIQNIQKKLEVQSL